MHEKNGLLAFLEYNKFGLGGKIDYSLCNFVTNYLERSTTRHKKLCTKIYSILVQVQLDCLLLATVRRLRTHK
jgi:hypothetical protein